MTTFEATLKQFQDYILKQDSAIRKEITNTAQMGVESRLKIYRNAYYLRLLEVLACDFGMLKTYLGRECFDRLGREYIDAFPSSSASVIVFGHYFPDFLSRRSDITNEQLELAQFEWALEKARPVSVVSHVAAEQLSRIAPDVWADIRFTLNPTVEIFESSWKAPQFWRAIAKDLPLPAVESNKTPEMSLIWAGKGIAHFCALDAQSRCFLDALKSGKNFGEVCEALCQVMAEEKVGEFAGRYLNQWIVDQIIVDFKVM